MWGPVSPELAEAARRAGVPGLPLAVLCGVVAAGALVAGCPKSGEPDTAVISTITQMGFIDNQIGLFASEEHRAPTTREGLALVFDGATPKDAWGNPFQYVAPGPDGRAYDVVSLGSDGREGGRGTAVDLVWSEVKKTLPPEERATP